VAAAFFAAQDVVPNAPQSAALRQCNFNREEAERRIVADC